MSREHIVPSYRMLDFVMTDSREPMRGAPPSAMAAWAVEGAGKRKAGAAQKREK
jgi:hypothetical protein